jgi:DUF4097 and DUF4098 domain-containing protein YvlB
VRERLTWTNGKNKPKPQHIVEDGALTLSSKCAHATIGFTKCGMSYRVQVPRSTPVEVDNSDGAVVARGLGGAVKLHSDNGRLTVTDLRASSVKLTTDDGAIDVSGHAKTVDLHSDNGSINTTGLTADQLSASTNDGNINLGGRATVADLHTDNGSIKAGGLTAQQITAKTANGEIDLRLDTAPTKVRGTSANGTVHVRVPTSESYAIELSTADGQERIDSAVHRDSRSAHQIRLRSDNGNVCVSPA